MITTYQVTEPSEVSAPGAWTIDLVAGDRLAITARHPDGRALQIVLRDALGAALVLCKTPQGVCTLHAKVRQSGRHHINVSDVSGVDAHAPFELIRERQLPRRMRSRIRPKRALGGLLSRLVALRGGPGGAPMTVPSAA